MGIKNFQIFLDNPTGKYNAGSNITGKIQFTLDDSMKIRALKMKFEGMAKVSWVAQFLGKYVTWTATEECFLNKFNLAGEPRKIVIPPGDHVYPFTTFLPPLIPSSFEGSDGDIKYTMKATLDRPCKFNKHVKKVFTVVTPIDLNDNAEAKEPVKLEVKDMLIKCCLCCRSELGEVKMVISLPYTGFVPGQNIPVTLEVDNDSSERVKKIVITLYRVVEYVARKPYKRSLEVTIEIETWTLGGVEPNNSKLFI